MSLLNALKTSVAIIMHPISSRTEAPVRQEIGSQTSPSLLPRLVSQNPTLSRSLGLWPLRGIAPLAERIIESARQSTGTRYQWGGESKKGMDCSHFVHHVYRQSGISYPYTTTHGDWKKAGFVHTQNPQRGDLILWKGHVGIVVDPERKIFIGAQKSTGVAEASYAAGKYWGQRTHSFLRHQGAF